MFLNFLIYKIFVRFLFLLCVEFVENFKNCGKVNFLWKKHKKLSTLHFLFLQRFASVFNILTALIIIIIKFI